MTYEEGFVGLDLSRWKKKYLKILNQFEQNGIFNMLYASQYEVRLEFTDFGFEIIEAEIESRHDPEKHPAFS